MQYVRKLDEAARTTPEQWRAARPAPKAVTPNPEYRLAMLYTGRDKQTHNLPEASRLLKQAAAQDHANAQFALATRAPAVAERRSRLMWPPRRQCGARPPNKAIPAPSTRWASGRLSGARRTKR